MYYIPKNYNNSSNGGNSGNGGNNNNNGNIVSWLWLFKKINIIILYLSRTYLYMRFIIFYEKFKIYNIYF